MREVNNGRKEEMKKKRTRYIPSFASLGRYVQHTAVLRKSEITVSTECWNRYRETQRKFERFCAERGLGLGRGLRDCDTVTSACMNFKDVVSREEQENKGSMNLLRFIHNFGRAYSKKCLIDVLSHKSCSRRAIGI